MSHYVMLQEQPAVIVWCYPNDDGVKLKHVHVIMSDSCNYSQHVQVGLVHRGSDAI